MYKLILRPAFLMVFTVWITDSSAQVLDKPLTFCNPLSIDIGSDRARRLGEPVIVLHKNDYYLFVQGAEGYWYSGNLRDWTYVEPVNLPIVNKPPSVVVIHDTFYFTIGNFSAKYPPDLYATKDPKKGVWKKVGTLNREYGDAAMFVDDNDKVYMYWGWSQIEGIKAVELDPKNNFREKGEPVACFFGNETVYGWEQRRHDDLGFIIIRTRPYLPEEAPWIEGPWMTKFSGKYYLQYVAVGVEFVTYADGIYVSDNPLGPFKYSPHNPFTIKANGFVTGTGHSCTFQDKKGNYWHMVTMVSSYAGRGRNQLGLFPAAFDADGVLHCNTEFGDYPQYFPGIKENPVRNNFAGWMLLSRKKFVQASSSLEGYAVENAVDENVTTYWCAGAGNPGEYMTIDLGKECEISAIQVNFDQHDASEEFTTSRRNERYQSYTVQVSGDKNNWTTVIDKSNNTKDFPHDYTELSKPVNARYVKLTNVFTPGNGKFAVKDLRVFGNQKRATFSQADNVTIVRDKEDRRSATIMWEPVKGADGYIVRYGVEPDKLYNHYMIYDDYKVTINTLYRDAEYYFMVEAFDSGTDYYRERSTQTMGRGIELELFRDDKMVERKMIYEGQNDYVYENITPGQYYLRHAHDGVLWRGELIKEDVIGSGDKATLMKELFEIGRGEEVLGELVIKVLPGKESGKFIVTFRYDKQ
jgi:hypothetical protein